MRAALEAINREVPYNSFGKILLADGHTYPERLGGNCVFQMRRLTNRLIHDGLQSPIQYMTATQRPHWVGVVQEDEGARDTFLLDPFVLPTEPMNLSKMMTDGEVTYAAHPVLDDKASHVKVVRTGEKTFDVKLHALKPNGSSKLVHTYSYNLQNTHVELPPDDYQLLAGVNQKKLEMGLLREDGGVTRVYVQPETGAMNMLKVGKDKLSAEIHPDAFHAEFELIATELGTDVETLHAFFQKGLRAYLARHAI